MKYVPDDLKTQEMCVKAVEKDVFTLQFISDHLKTQEMCNEAVDIEPLLLVYVPNCYKMLGMCYKAICREPYTLMYVPGDIMTQEMCKGQYVENHTQCGTFLITLGRRKWMIRLCLLYCRLYSVFEARGGCLNNYLIC